VTGVNSYEDFYASHNHMPGSSRTLRVTGTVMFITEGWDCSVQEASNNKCVNDKMLHLELHLKSPGDGTGVPEVLTPCPFEWSVDDPPIDYEQVEFTVIGTDDEPPPVLDIDHPV
jgi:hypothetical protein